MNLPEDTNGLFVYTTSKERNDILRAQDGLPPLTDPEWRFACVKAWTNIEGGMYEYMKTLDYADLD